ncbi:MAG TPA: hypothetical protein VF540_00390, partial [Segetibacter sp.]
MKHYCYTYSGKMQISVSILLVFLSLSLQAQNCEKYYKAIKSGNDYLNHKNYDSALKEFQVAQIAARECGKVTNEPADKLKEVFRGLQAQRDEAVKQKIAALKATQIAVQEKKRANLAQQVTEDQKEAFRLILLAKKKAAEDPTIALRVAEVALKKYPDTLITKEAYQIYQQNAFYKTIVRDSSAFGIFYAGAVSPDGTKVLIGSRKAEATLWSTDGSLLTTFKGHKDAIYSVAFSKDGKKVLTGSGDKKAILWNVGGTVIRVFEGHKRNITSVAFSPDGTKILTGSYDKTARL